MSLFIEFRDEQGRKRCSGPFPEDKLWAVLARAKADSMKGGQRVVRQTCGKGRPSKLRVYDMGLETHKFRRNKKVLSDQELLQWVKRKPCAVSLKICPT